MATTAEVIFWCVCVGLTLLAVCAIPMVSNYLAYKDVEKMFDRR